MTNAVEPTCESQALSPLEERMLSDLRWAADQEAALEQLYPGECVLIMNQQIIGHGPSEGEALAEAVRRGFPREGIVVFEIPAFLEAPR